MNKHKPTFNRSSAARRKNVKYESWRKPRGIHNKKRKRTHKGPMPQPGYGSPKTTRNTLPDGNPTRIVITLQEIEQCKSCIIGHVGMKRRKELLIKAKQKGIKVWNYDTEKELAKIENKRQKTKDKKAHAKIEEKKVEAKTPEEQKEADQKQAEKILTRPQ